MGYRCPVCAHPQADDTHLANHLAFTALARGGDHEAWLEERVPDWAEMGETDLAARVREMADPVEYPAVFEDTTGHGHDHAMAGGPTLDHDELDEETRAVIEEAREMTRERRGGEDSDGDGA